VAARRSRRSPPTTPSTRSRSASGRRSCWWAPASCSPGARRARTRRRDRPRRPSCSSRSGGCRWSWSGSKKVSAALMPVNCACWSITTTPSSASAANVRCWACPDPRSITGLHRCRHRPCGSWPGSMLSIWKTRAAAAAGWWTTWPEKGSRSVVTGHETSWAAWGYGRSTQNLAPPFQEIQQSAFPAWWISTQSRLSTRSGLPTSPTSRYRKDVSTWWRSWISSPGPCSAGSSRSHWLPRSGTALTRSSVWMPLRWRWKVAAGPRSFTPIKAASSPLVTSLRGCRLRRSGSAGQAANGVTTTSSLSDCGEQSSMTTSTSVPTAMAGRLSSAWPAFCGGTAM
jgi:hypothetical protein